MKKLVFLFLGLICALPIFAQGETVTDPSVSEFILDFGTFTGVMAIIDAALTQVSKLVPYINSHKWAKVLMAIVFGIILCFIGWGLNISPFIAGVEWWGVLIAGVAAGLSACGFYSVIQAIWALFKK